MKINHHASRYLPVNIRKTLVLLLFAACSGLMLAQNQKVTFKASTSTIQKVFEEIEKQTKLTVSYNQTQLDIAQAVSLQTGSKPVSQILEEALRNTGFTFQIENKHIIIIPLKSTTATEVKGQPRKVSGVVKDKTGEPIIGANVVLKGTTNGTVTDIDGMYSLNVPSSGTLQISYIGYFTQEIAVSGKNAIDVKLVEDSQTLDEVVVVGYGTQRKGELTSSIASVKSDNFVKGAVQDAAQLLQGKVAGLGIVLPNGDPTATTQIMLRGVGTLLSGTSPLVIIDGVPGDLTTVAAEDIESLDVVKDGSAAAIYGTRGNNGVIFITTKKVKGEIPLSIDIHAYATVQHIKKKLDMMNASQYRELVGRKEIGAMDYGYDTDWLDEVTQTPVSWVTNVSLKGGTTKSNYIANVNYRSSQGIIKRSDNNVLTTRLEVNHSMWDNLLKLNFNLMGREQKSHRFADGDGFREDIYKNALAYNPTDRPKDDDGKWVERPTMYEYANPLAMINESEGQNKSMQLRTFGSATLTPIEQLFIKALVSHTVYNQTRGYSESKNHISNIRDNRNGYAAKGSTHSIDDLVELTAQYKENFGKHGVTGLVGYSYQEKTWEEDYMKNWDFPSDQYTYNNMGAGAALKRGEAEMSAEKSKSVLIGLFARANYNFDNKYLVSVSLRHEGSSKFGANNKWGNFPAMSIGWNITNEGFMKELPAISNLKLRAGFGITGTVIDDPYLSLSQLTSGDNFLSDGMSWVPTLKPSSNANPDLRWEKKEEWNLGIDYGFLNERISGSIDLYKRITRDMLWDYQVPTPPFLYQEMTANAGTMQNKGIEVRISAIPVQTKDFQWVTTVNYSTNKNKIVSMSNDKFQVQSGFIDAGWLGQTIKQNTHRLFEGGEAGNFWGFKTVDIDADGKWMIEGKDGNPKPIAEQQPDDKKILGNGLPKHFLSWDNSLTYKNFDLNITMRGAFDYQILNTPRLNYDCPVNLTHGNLLATAYDPKFNKSTLSSQQELQYVSYFIEDGGFWKIDNITLGYTLNLKNNYLKRVRVYASGSNLFTITGYSGIDPEVNFLGLDPGVDSRDRYPSTRSFTLGAMFTF